MVIGISDKTVMKFYLLKNFRNSQNNNYSMDIIGQCAIGPLGITQFHLESKIKFRQNLLQVVLKFVVTNGKKLDVSMGKIPMTLL